MKKAIIIIAGICLLSIALLAWNNKSIKNNNIKLEARIRVLEEEKKLLQEKVASLNEELKPVSLMYIGYDEKYRFIDKEIKAYQLPRKESSQIGSIPAMTLVKVEDCVIFEDGEEWAYIELPSCILGEQVNCKVWVRRNDTQELTKENQDKIIHGVTIKEGTPIYPMIEYDEIKNTKSEPYWYDAPGNISKRLNGYVHISIAGGMDFWVEEKYIVYPLD